MLRYQTINIMKYVIYSDDSSQECQKTYVISSQTLIRQAIKLYNIEQMSTYKEYQEIQNEFTKINLNHEGILQKYEFMKIQLKSDTKLIEDNVDRIIDLIDVNRSGMIDFLDLCMTALDQEKLFSIQRIEQSTNILDQVIKDQQNSQNND